MRWRLISSSPVGADPADAEARLVRLHRVLHRLLDLAPVAGAPHVDEIDDDQAADVAQAQLAADLRGRLDVRADRGFLLARPPLGAPRVDVDGGEGFGRVDHDGTARGQVGPPLEDVLDLRFQVVDREQRPAARVAVQRRLAARHEGAHVLLGPRVGRVLVDPDLLNRLVEVVAQALEHDVLVAVEQLGALRVARVAGDAFPQAEQRVHVPAERRLRLPVRVRADDHAAAVRDGQGLRHRLQLEADLLRVDLAGDAAGRIERRQHQVAPRQTQVGRQGGALGALGLAGDLNDDRPSADEHVLDLRPLRLGDRLVVGVRHHVLNGEEAVLRSAVVDEGGVQARLNVRDLAVVDVAAGQAAFGDVDLQVFEHRVVGDGDAELGRALRVDEHSSGHKVSGGRLVRRRLNRVGRFRLRGRRASAGLRGRSRPGGCPAVAAVPPAREA